MRAAASRRVGDTAGAAERYVAGGTSESNRRCRRLAAARFASLFGDLTGWARASTAQRLAAPVAVRGFAAFAVVQAGIAVDADYVVRIHRWPR